MILEREEYVGPRRLMGNPQHFANHPGTRKRPKALGFLPIKKRFGF